MAAVTAPSVGAIDVGNALSKGAQLLKNGGRVLGAGAVAVAVGSIFPSQSLGTDADKIPGLDSPEGIAMANHAKRQAQATPKTQAKDASCSKDDKSCKDKQEHRGNIQAQEGTKMLCGVSTPLLAKWHTYVVPPHAFIMAAIKAVRLQISDLMSSSYQKGADVAEMNIIAYYSTPAVLQFGLRAENEVFCYFNGVVKKGRPAKFKGENSRRIDGTVYKGSIIK